MMVGTVTMIDEGDAGHGVGDRLGGEQPHSVGGGEHGACDRAMTPLARHRDRTEYHDDVGDRAVGEQRVRFGFLP